MNTKQILENWPPALSNQELETLCEHAVDYALTNGTIMRTKPVTAFTAQHAPFSLFPTPYPRRNYEQALELQPLFNMLKHKVSQDTAFIESTFSEYVCMLV